MAENYCPVSLLSLISKILKNFEIRGLLVTLRNVAFCLISGLVSGLLNQLQIFWQLYMIELLGLSVGLRLLELQHLIYLRLSTGFGTIIFFVIFCFMGFLVSYLASFCLFSVKDGFEKSSQEYSVNDGVSQGSILCPALSLLCIKDPPGDVICNINIYVDSTVLYSSVIRHLICGR